MSFFAREEKKRNKKEKGAEKTSQFIFPRKEAKVAQSSWSAQSWAISFLLEIARTALEGESELEEEKWDGYWRGNPDRVGSISTRGRASAVMFTATGWNPDWLSSASEWRRRRIRMETATTTPGTRNSSADRNRPQGWGFKWKVLIWGVRQQTCGSGFILETESSLPLHPSTTFQGT